MDMVTSPLKGLLPGVLVSIDIETTGLNAKEHDILEVAAICFKLDPNQTDVQRFHCFLKHPVLRWDPSTFEFHMKNDYFNYVRSEAVRDVPRMELETFERQFIGWLASCDAYVPGQRGGGATAVGKNFGSFDLQFLNELNYGSFRERNAFKHRAVDLGNLLWNPISDGVTLPSSEKCAERMGHSAAQIRHRAMDDAEIMMEMCRKAISKLITVTV